MIVVLTLGRSGSSLVMRTLGTLGCEIIGRKFDDHRDPEVQNRHMDLNPFGYFEEPEIYYGGPRSEIFRRHLLSSAGRKACKMDLRNLVDEQQLPEWDSAAPGISRLIISIRDPSEQAHSELLATGRPEDLSSTKMKFAFVSNFLADYAKIVCAIQELMEGSMRALATKMCLIDFSEARDPEIYVKRLCDLAGLRPQAEQVVAAVSDISPALYRVKHDEISAEEVMWAKRLGASDAYRSISRFQF